MASEHENAPGAAGSRPEGSPSARAVAGIHATVGVGLIVVGPDGRVLLGQAHDGNWELPGGKVDPGERFEETAVRELAEETSLRADPRDVELLAVQLSADPEPPTRLTVAALTRSAEGDPAVTEPHKIARWRWFAPEEIPGALYPPSAAVLRVWRPDLGALPPAPSHDYPARATRGD
ncbi:nucleotide triphosphate diphosphatase NUDT15 [Streptomyces lavendulae]|uniref:nucleotide triphosphate diphosphatase NUDT15 n=1 Tax=Streptomyces lavendulae TaxID=1914 RepID=UPI0024A3757A|nr:NUDIX domain-containing protein [Streptomyces lavendulae]GLX17682.1 DNA mismatch repair protein MutT [Streptomyces lavendulae subsp. lavendulae]GLX24457.1 DNA mismatch repair protein MutT [Streptomyces lavendulae subsp. lavendulae]